MDPERWAEITGGFAIERDRNTTGSARRSVSHTKLFGAAVSQLENDSKGLTVENDGDRIFSPASEQDENFNSDLRKSPKCAEDYNHIINVLKTILKEKVKENNTQKKEILCLKAEIAKVKPRSESEDTFTQTSASCKNKSRRRRNRDMDERIGWDTVKIGKTEENGKWESERTETEVVAKPMSEIILEKIDIIEKRMDGFLNLIQNHFPKSSYAKFHFNKLGKDEPPAASTASTKPWNKPPILQPKSTCCSSLREAYSRTTRSSNNSNNKVCTRERYEGSTGETIAKAPDSNLYGINECNRDIHSDPFIEERLQFLESLVTQLKQKFMRVLLTQRKNMIRINKK